MSDPGLPGHLRLCQLAAFASVQKAVCFQVLLLSWMVHFSQGTEPDRLASSSLQKLPLVLAASQKSRVSALLWAGVLPWTQGLQQAVLRGGLAHIFLRGMGRNFKGITEFPPVVF